MDSINLIDDIQSTHVLEGGSKEDPFTSNVESGSYSRYLELLDTFYKQSIKSKFTKKYFKQYPVCFKICNLSL